jgi:hypothetical protein
LQRRKKPKKRTKKIQFNHGTSGPKVFTEAVVEKEVAEEEEVTVNQSAPSLIPPTLASTFPRRPALN